MITLGTRHTGGLYGDGNLTLVDGYRELNITNYGTDYYSIAKQIGIDAYHKLPEREADYYELRYTCLLDCQDKDGTLYKQATTDASGFTTKASTITADEMQNLFVTKDGSGNQVSVKQGGIDILKYDKDAGEWVPNTKIVNDEEKPIFWDILSMLSPYSAVACAALYRDVAMAPTDATAAVTPAAIAVAPFLILFPKLEENLPPDDLPAFSAAVSVVVVSSLVIVCCAPFSVGIIVTDACATSITFIHLSVLPVSASAFS